MTNYNSDYNDIIEPIAEALDAKYLPRTASLMDADTLPINITYVDESTETVQVYIVPAVSNQEEEEESE